MRLIGGLWKRSKLSVLDQPGLRPTPDRVRETLFNWLGQDLSGWRCVDAFAGTGALGFEAASRGASSVLLLERDPALVAKLLQAKERLSADMVEIQRVDALVALARLAEGSVDLLLLDPPFASDLAALALAQARRLLSPHGFVYLEAGSRCGDEALQQWGLSLHRYLKAGAVHAHLLQRRSES